MINNYIKVEFKDEIYYISADKLEDGGCMELQPDMSDSGVSWAYLDPLEYGGSIKQYQQVIGHFNDLKIIEDE